MDWLESYFRPTRRTKSLEKLVKNQNKKIKTKNNQKKLSKKKIVVTVQFWLMQAPNKLTFNLLITSWAKSQSLLSLARSEFMWWTFWILQVLLQSTERIQTDKTFNWHIVEKTFPLKDGVTIIVKLLLEVQTCAWMTWDGARTEVQMSKFGKKKFIFIFLFFFNY